MLELGLILALLAHPGQGPPVAWPDLPHEAGERADTEFTFTWTDSDMPVTTGTATIDWFYTDRMPPTYQPGLVPDDLIGEPVVRGIPEADLTNRHTWDTSMVPAGSYFLWSRVNEPLIEMPLLRVIAFSRGVVTVAHPGDEVHPAVAITRPDSPYHIAEGDYRVEWGASDPDGTGTVILEGTTSTTATDFVTLVDNMAATSTGTFVWPTSEYPEGNWTLRITIRDGRGLSFTAYSRYFLRVERPFPMYDAGSGGIDAGADGGRGRRFADAAAYDGGTPPPAPTASCTCTAAPDGRGFTGLLVGFIGLLGWRRRSMLTV